MRAIGVLLLHVAIAPVLLGATPRISFERIIPAPYDLGRIEEVAIVRAIGDDSRIEQFLAIWIEHTNRSRTLRMRDIRFTTGPADAHVDVKSFRCSTTQREGEVSTRDADGKRVRRRGFAVDALCTAKVAVLSRTLEPLFAFEVKGEGSSPRALVVTDEERMEALDDAARHAALAAAERITPRRVRETIVLDETAPAIEEATSLLDGARLPEVRTLWQAAAKKHPQSAAIQFNLGAVCEAIGDRKAAEKHYTAAHDLAPQERRYKSELRLFMLRGSGGR